MARKASPRAIGAFVVGAVALAVVAIAILGSGNLFDEKWEMISYFDGTVAGLGVGSPVKIRGVQIGQVREVRLGVPGGVVQTAEDFRIPVIYEIDRSLLVKHGARRDLTNRTLDSLIDAGLRASLALESFVTGRRYVELDLLPDSEAVFQGGDELPYPEIPTTDTGLDKLQGSIRKLVESISRLPVDSLLIALTGTARNAELLLSDPELARAIEEMPRTLASISAAAAGARDLTVGMDSSLVPIREELAVTAREATEALRSLQETLEAMRTSVRWDGAIGTAFRESMEESAATMRALRALAETLEQEPGSLIRGRDYQENQP
jgi:paraquat-inducible protein B